MASKASKPLATGSPTSHSCNTFCFFFLYQNITDAGLDKTILNNFYCAKTAAQVSLIIHVVMVTVVLHEHLCCVTALLVFMW